MTAEQNWCTYPHNHRRAEPKMGRITNLLQMATGVLKTLALIGITAERSRMGLRAAWNSTRNQGSAGRLRL